MKKLFVILSAILWSFTSFGQSQDGEPKFHFGVKVAPGVSWLKSDNSGENNATLNDGSLLRLSYGFITDFRISANYTFSTGVDVNYEGGKLKRQPNDSTLWNQKLRLQYIEIPLTIRLNTNRIGYLKYYFQAGIAPGINLRSNYDATEVSTKNSYENDYTNKDVMKDINAINLSMIIGGGLNYNLTGSTDLLLGITFHNGLIDVTDKDASNQVLKESKLKANLVSLNVGILF